jgi:hypothetical protein
MNTAKIYTDTEGNECTIHQMVKREPGWAANRIQAGEDAIDKVSQLQDLVIWMTGCGYDFCQHVYFTEQRDKLLKDKDTVASLVG